MFTQPACLNILSAGRYFTIACILWMEKLRHRQQVSYCSSSSTGAHCLFPFPSAIHASPSISLVLDSSLNSSYCWCCRASKGNGHLVIEGLASLWREYSNLTQCKRSKASDAGGRLGFSCLAALSV